MTAEGDGWGQGYGVLTDLGFISEEIDGLLHKLTEEGGGTITIEAVSEKITGDVGSVLPTRQGVESK
jgi:hypothetical protein